MKLDRFLFCDSKLVLMVLNMYFVKSISSKDFASGTELHYEIQGIFKR